MPKPASDTGWFKSSFSGSGNDQCVECRIVDGAGVLVRHSKHPEVPPFVFTDGEWEAFLKGAKSGEFDLRD